MEKKTTALQRQQKEVDDNFTYFQGLLKGNKIAPDKYGTFALLKNKKISGYYSTWEDAYKSGNLAYKNKLFSVQEVTSKIIGLGYFSYAVA